MKLLPFCSTIAQDSLNVDGNNWRWFDTYTVALVEFLFSIFSKALVVQARLKVISPLGF